MEGDDSGEMLCDAADNAYNGVACCCAFTDAHAPNPTCECDLSMVYGAFSFLLSSTHTTQKKLLLTRRARV